jgi:hypothetical protein
MSANALHLLHPPLNRLELSVDRVSFVQAKNSTYWEGEYALQAPTGRVIRYTSEKQALAKMRRDNQ